MGIESKYIRHNGNYIEWNEDKDHTVIHALHYGTSVFEGIRFYQTDNGTKIFRLYDHIERLFYSAKTMEMQLEYNVDNIVEVCQQLVHKNGLNNGYIRPLIYYGYGKMGLDPTGAKIEFTISCWPWGKYLSDNAISVGISNYIRPHPKSININAKVGGYYVNSMLSHSDTKKRGFDEALLLDYKGNIAEGPGENIFFIKNNSLFTPELGSILPGITRNTIIELAKNELGIKVYETEISTNDLKDFDEAFFVGTAAEVTLIGDITDLKSNKFIYKTDLGEKIKNMYMDLVKGKNKKYDKRLF